MPESLLNCPVDRAPQSGRQTAVIAAPASFTAAADEPIPAVAFLPLARAILADGAGGPPGDRRTLAVPATGPERRAGTERRGSLDRRVVDIGSPTGLERRRGPGRRLSEARKSAEEGQLNDEQFEFVLAIDTYKRVNSRPFPSWTEILEVVKQLGYRKVEASTISLPAGTSRSQTLSPSPPLPAARTPLEPAPGVSELFHG